MLIEEIAQQFDQLFAITSSQPFLQKKALGGEIPFFIYPYDPKQEVVISNNIALLKKRLLNQAGIETLEINLFHLGIELLEEKGLLQKVLDKEAQMDKNRLLKALQNSLDTASRLIPAIAQKIADTPHQVMFVTGIGQVFPYIRSHQVLNNLQSIATEAPTVIFFPGQYTGVSLELFGKLKDDNYYRAFNINDYKVN